MPRSAATAPRPDWASQHENEPGKPRAFYSSRLYQNSRGATPIFNEQSLADAARSDHRTRVGAWWLPRVVDSEVGLTLINPPSEHLMTPERPAVIPPQATHHVVTLRRKTT